MVAWDRVTRADVVRPIKEYDRLGPERFFSEHGFAPTTTYDLAWEERRYPPKAILGTAYEFATLLLFPRKLRTPTASPADNNTERRGWRARWSDAQ